MTTENSRISPLGDFCEVMIAYLSHTSQKCQKINAHCYELNVFVPKNSYVETLNPSVMVFEGGALGRQLGQTVEPLQMTLMSV